MSTGLRQRNESDGGFTNVLVFGFWGPIGMIGAVTALQTIEITIVAGLFVVLGLSRLRQMMPSLRKAAKAVPSRSSNSLRTSSVFSPKVGGGRR